MRVKGNDPCRYLKKVYKLFVLKTQIDAIEILPKNPIK